MLYLDVALSQAQVARLLLGCARIGTGTRLMTSLSTVEAEAFIGTAVLCQMAHLTAAFICKE